ncbi:MAG: hypothetical protein H7Z73_12735 [Candidatus Saccharibacteria bacterium]|nr:hypothetical protein [Moraxellaceae bacterium]
MFLVLTSTTFLTGCSREPSESDIKTAYSNEVDQTNALTRKFGGEALAIKLNDLKKISCQESNKNKEQFQCNVEIDSTLPMLGKHQEKTTITLAKSDIGNGKQDWIVLRGIDTTH